MGPLSTCWLPVKVGPGIGILGGELPTNRLGGAHNPGDFNGISGGNVHLYLG